MSQTDGWLNITVNNCAEEFMEWYNFYLVTSLQINQVVSDIDTLYIDNEKNHKWQ